MYHEVTVPEKIYQLTKITPPAFVLDIKQFERQIKSLHDSGYEAWSLQELISWLSGGLVTPPAKPIILTFDDGFKGNYEFALPVLKNYGFKATFFVIVNKIGESQMMTWEHLEELSETGMSIQSHTLSHRALGLLDPGEIANELKVSKDKLEQSLSSSIDFLSFPYGSYKKWYKKIAIESGYLGACTSDFGKVELSCDPFRLKRIPIKSNLSFMNFRKIADGHNFFYKKTMMTQNLKMIVRKTIGEQHIYNIYNRIYGLEKELSI